MLIFKTYSLGYLVLVAYLIVGEGDVKLTGGTNNEEAVNRKGKTQNCDTGAVCYRKHCGLPSFQCFLLNICWKSRCSQKLNFSKPWGVPSFVSKILLAKNLRHSFLISEVNLLSNSSDPSVAQPPAQFLYLIFIHNYVLFLKIISGLTKPEFAPTHAVYSGNFSKDLAFT